MLKSKPMMWQKLTCASAGSFAALSALLALVGGCGSPAPAPGIRAVAYDTPSPAYRPKPLPPNDYASELPPPPFYDPPLVNQPVPEQRQFVEAYRQVGRPRIVVFVNRNLHADAVPHDIGQPAPDPIRGNPFRPPNPIEFRDPGEQYLNPGQYDEAQFRRIDFATIETTLTQWLACDGHVTILSPTGVREPLTEDATRKLQADRQRLLGDMVKNLSADILIQVQAQPSRQAGGALAIRLVGEAVNVRDGEQVGRATVLVPVPLESETINVFTRFVARRLMSDMTQTWAGNRPPEPRPLTAPPASATPPAGITPIPAQPTEPARPPAVPQPAAPPPAAEPADPPAPTPRGSVPVSPPANASNEDPRAVPAERPSILERRD